MAGAAANLALPALAQAARALEAAHARGLPSDPGPATQAWQTLTDWLAIQPTPADTPRTATAAPTAAGIPSPDAAAAPLLARLSAACYRGEIDETVLTALAADYPAHAAALRAALDTFDFEAALTLLARWSLPPPSDPPAKEPPPDA